VSPCHQRRDRLSGRFDIRRSDRAINPVSGAMSVGSNQFGAELIARLRHRREFFACQVLAGEKLSGAAVMAGTMQLPKLVKTALDETRMLVLGAQILLGFELSGIFRDRFETLPMLARYLDGIALLLMIITVALRITPESYHQMVEVGADTGRFHRLISRMAGFSLLPFALSLGIALFITGESYFRILGWPRRRLLFRPSRLRLLVRPSISAATANGSKGAGNLGPSANRDGNDSPRRTNHPDADRGARCAAGCAGAARLPARQRHQPIF